MALFRSSRLALLAVLCGLAGSTFAQTYPSGPIRIVVPYPPGGGTDILTRQIAHRLNESWSVPVIVDNRGGAAGTIGTALVAKAPADGQTLLVVPSGFAVNPSIHKNLPYDSVRDLTPVSQLASSPLILCVHPSFPPRSAGAETFCTGPAGPRTLLQCGPCSEPVPTNRKGSGSS